MHFRGGYKFKNNNCSIFELHSSSFTPLSLNVKFRGSNARAALFTKGEFMAQVRDLSTGLLLPLRAHHTFGRFEPQVDSCVESSSVSRIHAVIEWDGHEWLLRDLSRNGTWVDEQKLNTGTAHQLQPGQKLYFGSQTQTAWFIENLHPPRDVLITNSDQCEDVYLDKFHFLPSDENPEKAIHQSTDDGMWYLESIADGESRPLAHGQTVSCGDQNWTLFLVEHIPATEQIFIDPRQFTDYHFSFRTSLDEESTQLSLESDVGNHNLGERSHHYVLLHLARLKAEDAARGIDESSQGWVDTDILAQNLGVDAAHINILIFRARKQLTEALPKVVGIKSLIQRLRGRLRFAGSEFTVHKGAELIHQLSTSQN